MRLATAVIAALAITVAACGSGGDDDGMATPRNDAAGDWPAFFDVLSLVQASDVVVIAEMTDETTETVVAPEDGSTTTTITEIVREFEVLETLKSDLQPGDHVFVFNTANVAVKDEDGSTRETVYQVLRLEQGTAYLLFLTLVEVPDYYPDEYGASALAAPAEPHTAVVEEDGTLRWQTTGRYDQSLALEGLETGEQGAAPAFDVTLDALRALTIAGGSGAVPVDETPAASPTP